MKKAKKMIATLCIVVVLAGMPLTAFASAKNGTSPGLAWKLTYCNNGFWYVKSLIEVGSNYYSTNYNKSKATVKDGKGKSTTSGWILQNEAWAKRNKTKGTNSAYYDYKN